MARVMVQTDKNHVLLVDEKNVRPIHPGSEESAGQLLDRIGWAIPDAERRTARRTMRKYVAAVVPAGVQQSIRKAKAQGSTRLGSGGGVSP